MSRASQVRIAEKDLDRIVDILSAIPEARVAAMQRALAAVWHRFAWTVQVTEAGGAGPRCPCAEGGIGWSPVAWLACRRHYWDDVWACCGSRRPSRGCRQAETLAQLRLVLRGNAGVAERKWRREAEAAGEGEPATARPPPLPDPDADWVGRDDAFATIMAWLHSRIADTRT